MALTAALQAWVWSGISRAEATVGARQTHRFAFVILRVVQHPFVAVALQKHLLASVAGVGISLVLALHASVRIAMEGAWIFLFAARCAYVASGAPQTSVPCCLSGVFPLRGWKSVLCEELAANGALLF